MHVSPLANIKQALVSLSVQQSSGLLKALYSLLPWQTCSFRHHLNFSGKHPAICYI
ncbi:hypothetical protein NP493_155g00000 [Ridgeia piscesae]|uniref:Uncharacterized protein n=1 Tax=Ridgeia piscesae TaxID=27915 RepID=A0AAD9UFV6_RIDPI|nr:hypothetical protein NP493_155g00000 [Ridgeia piscesae]